MCFEKYVQTHVLINDGSKLKKYGVWVVSDIITLTSNFVKIISLFRK